MGESIAGLILLFIFVGIPLLVLASVGYASSYKGEVPFRRHLWQLAGVPFRVLVPSFLSKLLGAVRNWATKTEVKLHEKTVEGTIAETRNWHTELKTMEGKMTALGLSPATMAEFGTKLTSVQQNGDALETALNLHRDQQVLIAQQESRVRELELLLINMRAMHMSEKAIGEVEAKLMEAMLQASQATVASQVIAKYLGSHSTMPGGMLQALPQLLNQQLLALPVQQQNAALTAAPTAAPVGVSLNKTGQ